jgi:hypothetical protein
MDGARLRQVVVDLLRSPVPWFLAFSLFLLWVHEPWRDEAEVWLIGRDSLSLGAFFQTMRYEGTPPVWHLGLMALAKLGAPFWSARLLHVAVATAGVALVWLRAPFSRSEKWLWAFGYYTAYEYDALTRSYALLCLVLFAVAAFDRQRHARPLAYGGLLALLANVTLHGFLIACILAAAFGLERLRARTWTWAVMRGALVVMGGLALAAFLMRPPPDLAPWLQEWHVAHPWVYNSFRSVLQAFVPIPSSHRVFWNTNLLDGLSGLGKIVAALAIYAASCWTLRKSPPVLCIYLAATAVLEVLFMVKYYGGAHHAGLVFVLFMVCLWLARDRTAAAPLHGLAVSAVPAQAMRGARALAMFLPAILVLQVVAAAIAVERDATGEFSGAGDVARYLEANALLGPATFTTAYHSHSGMAILAQLHDTKARFFFAEEGRLGSNTPWTTKWQAGTHLTLDQVLAAIDAAAPPGSRLFLIDDAPHLEGTANATSRLTHLASFGPDLVGTQEEQFELYEVARAG